MARVLPGGSGSVREARSSISRLQVQVQDEHWAHARILPREREKRRGAARAVLQRRELQDVWST